MAVRKIDEHWYVDLRFRRQRVRRRSPVDTKGGAREYELLLRQELSASGNFDRLDPRKQKEAEEKVPTFAAFAERWLRDYVDVNNKPSEQTAKRSALRNHLLPAFGGDRLASITSLRIEQFKATKLQAGLAPKSINNYLTILHKCLSTAVEWSELETAPRVRFLKAPPPSFRYLREDELAGLLNAAPEGVWHTMILMAIHTGLRFCELAALEWNDVDLDRAILCVRRAVVRGHVGSPKNNRIRYVGLTSAVLASLRALPRSGITVFLWNGERVTYNAAEWFLRKTCRVAGLHPFGWHVLRHTFASLLAGRGAGLQAIKDLLGHSTINMTLRYAHLAPDTLRSAISLLETPSSDLGSRWAVATESHHVPVRENKNDVPILC